MAANVPTDGMERAGGPETLELRAAERARRHARGERERLLAMAAGRRDLVTLGRGDPDLPTPPHIVEAAQRALAEGATHYTDWQGREDLREAIADKCRQDYGMPVHPAQVIVTAGAQEAAYVAFQALVDPGDEVLLTDPHYTSYSAAVRLAGGVPVYVAAREERAFVVDPAEVEARVTPRTKLLLVVTPENPTGAVLPPDVVADLARIADRHDLLLVCDDIYERFVYEGPGHASAASLPFVQPRAILINGFSKTYSMTGWRLGYLVVPRALVDSMEVIKHTLTICAPAVSQAAGLAALQGPQDCVDALRRTYAERRTILVDGFERLGLGGRWSRGALYVFPRIAPTGLTAYDFCVRVLEEAGVQMFPGTAYGGGEGYVRTSFLQPAESLREAIDRLTAVLGALRNR